MVWTLFSDSLSLSVCLSVPHICKHDYIALECGCHISKSLRGVQITGNISFLFSLFFIHLSITSLRLSNRLRAVFIVTSLDCEGVKVCPRRTSPVTTEQQFWYMTELMTENLGILPLSRLVTRGFKGQHSAGKSVHCNGITMIRGSTPGSGIHLHQCST